MAAIRGWLVLLILTGVAVMLGSLGELYDRLIPDESSDPKHTRRWRKTLGNLVFLLVVGALTLLAALTTGLPRIGSIAWASDVAQQVEEAVQPLEDRLTKVEGVAEAQIKATRSMLAKIASDQILNLVKRRCKSRDTDERQYLTGEIARYAEEYEENKGKRYRIPSCDELEFRE